MILISTVTATRPGNLAKKVGLGEIGGVLIRPKTTYHSVLDHRAARRPASRPPREPAPLNPQEKPRSGGATLGPAPYRGARGLGNHVIPAQVQP